MTWKTGSVPKIQRVLGIYLSLFAISLLSFLVSLGIWVYQTNSRMVGAEALVQDLFLWNHAQDERIKRLEDHLEQIELYLAEDEILGQEEAKR
jgi:hypothetical protein